MLSVVVLISCCFFKQKTAYGLRISDGSSDVCSSDLSIRTSFAGSSASVSPAAGSTRRRPSKRKHVRSREGGAPSSGRCHVEPAEDGFPRWRYAPPSAPRGRTNAPTRSLQSIALGPSRRGERPAHLVAHRPRRKVRSEEHTSELQSLMRISYAVFCL